MKLTSHLSALLVLSFLSWNASAQVQVVRPAKASTQAVQRPAKTSTQAPTQAVQYGSFQRTKLLQQGRGSTGVDVLRLGAADRRALLTTGKSVYKKKPERRYYR